MSGLKFNLHVRNAKSFTLQDPIGVNRPLSLRLDRNESTRPVSGTVASAISAYLSNAGVHRYPTNEGTTGAISRYCGPPEEYILTTNGSDQAIDITLRTFLAEGSRMLVATPEFMPFRRIAGLLGAHVEDIPFEHGMEFPYAAFREAARKNPSLIVIINPNNPTGTLVDVEFIQEILVSHPGIPVIVDEAYFEFTGTTVVDLVTSYSNLIVLRTFSKAFSLAGLRIGYLVADPSILGQIKKLRNPFDVNELAAVAVQAQLGALEEVRSHVDEIMLQSKPAVTEFFRDLGVPIVTGHANFVLVKPEDCALTVRSLAEARVLVQPLHAPLVDGMFRVTIGMKSDMEEFFSIFAEIYRCNRLRH